MKRVAVISYHTCPLASQEGKETGGMNVYVLELSKELAKKGYTVDVFTRCQDGHNPKIVNVEQRMRVIHLTAGPQKPLSKKAVIPYLSEFLKAFQSFSKKENAKYDLVHCHYYLSGLIGVKIKKNLNIPMIMSFHTLALLKNLVARSEIEKEDKKRISAEFWLCKESDKIVVPSRAESLYLSYFYNCKSSKISIIPPGIDKSKFHPIPKSKAKKAINVGGNEKIILFVGRIEPLKGIDAIIYAMKIIVKKCRNLNVRLLIVGGDVTQKKGLWKKELQNLENLRHTLDIPDIVTFVGQRSQEELPNFYNSAEVVVMPSHYESFGIAALEAMACAVPVITSNVSGIAGIIDEDHESLITTVNNPLLLASQIVSLITYPAKHKKISEDVLESTKDFTWKNTALQMDSLYNLLTKGN